MSTATVVNKITKTELDILPSVIAAVQVAESVVDTTGESKFSAVLDTVTGVSGAVAQTSTNPQVESIAALVNLTVSVLNLLGHFRHKSATAASVPAA